MKTLEEIKEEVATENGYGTWEELSRDYYWGYEGLRDDTGRIDLDKICNEVAERYAEQFKPKWISVNERLPEFNTPVLLRAVTSWKRECIEYFSDKVGDNYEILEYGRYGYLLKNHSDFLVIQDPNPEEFSDEYISHWQHLTNTPEEKEAGYES